MEIGLDIYWYCVSSEITCNVMQVVIAGGNGFTDSVIYDTVTKQVTTGPALPFGINTGI